MNSLAQFQKWLEKTNEKCQNPDLKYFLDIIEIYNVDLKENKIDIK
jgi:hypothetical protein